MVLAEVGGTTQLIRLVASFNFTYLGATTVDEKGNRVQRFPNGLDVRAWSSLVVGGEGS